MGKKFQKFYDILSGTIIVLMVLMTILLVGVRLFGFQVFTVLSASMEPEYRTGSLIYVAKCDPFELQPGDDITYMASENTVVTHRIVGIVPDEDEPSVIRFRTKGIANQTEDHMLVHYKNVVGKPVFCIPFLGYLANYAQNPPGTYFAIAVCVLLLLLVFLPDLIADDEEEKKEAPAKQKKEKKGLFGKSKTSPEEAQEEAVLLPAVDAAEPEKAEVSPAEAPIERKPVQQELDGQISWDDLMPSTEESENETEPKQLALDDFEAAMVRDIERLASGAHVEAEQEPEEAVIIPEKINDEPVLEPQEPAIVSEPVTEEQAEVSEPVKEEAVTAPATEPVAETVVEEELVATPVQRPAISAEEQSKAEAISRLAAAQARRRAGASGTKKPAQKKSAERKPAEKKTPVRQEKPAEAPVSTKTSPDKTGVRTRKKSNAPAISKRRERELLTDDAQFDLFLEQLKLELDAEKV